MTETACQILKEIRMFRFLLCLFGLHGATEIDFVSNDPNEVFYKEVCRDCNKPIRWFIIRPKWSKLI